MRAPVSTPSSITQTGLPVSDIVATLESIYSHVTPAAQGTLLSKGDMQLSASSTSVLALDATTSSVSGLAEMRKESKDRKARVTKANTAWMICKRDWKIEHPNDTESQYKAYWERLGSEGQQPYIRRAKELVQKSSK